MSAAKLQVLVSDTTYWKSLAKSVQEDGHDVTAVMHREDSRKDTLASRFEREKFDVLIWPFQSDSSLARFHTAFVHTGEHTLIWRDLANALWQNDPDLPVIAFSNAHPHECRLELVNSHHVLFLGTALFLAELPRILDYLKQHVCGIRRIDVSLLYRCLFNIPWRYEYFLELSLRLLTLEQSESVEVVRRIIFGDQSPVEPQISDRYKPYEQVGGELSSDEHGKFIELRRQVEKMLEKHKGQNILTGGRAYKKYYDEICRLLSELAGPQTQIFLDNPGLIK